jgi:opacity protein-like surface antigen
MNTRCKPRAKWRTRFTYLTVLLAVTLGSARMACSQTRKYEISASYAYVDAHSSTGESFPLNGVEVSAAYHFTRRLGLVADFGRTRFGGLPTGLTSTMYTGLVGPRYTFGLHRLSPRPETISSRIAPYAQALFGMGYLDAQRGTVKASEKAFAMGLGGGVDFRVTRKISIRPVQADYLRTQFARADGTSATQGNLRLSAGIVFRLGYER